MNWGFAGARKGFSTAMLGLAAFTATMICSPAEAIIDPAHQFVVNGDFEQTTNGLGQLKQTTDLVGWTSKAASNGDYGFTFVLNPSTASTTGSPGQYGQEALWGPGNGANNGLSSSPTGGNFVGADGAYNVSKLTQAITGLIVGQTYTLSFNFAGAQEYGTDGASMDSWKFGFSGQGISQQTMKGAMDALVLADPAAFTTDIGPVIDEDAQSALEAHLAVLNAGGRVLKTLTAPEGDGTFFAPVLAEIPLADLPDREVFGPVLHVVRYDPEKLDEACQALAAKGYGLTLGVHSRIEGFARRVQALVPAGNIYVNRSITGAVVGVQPFGGEGLSGTGPKAGGPHALLRYAVERSVSVNIAAQGGDPALLNLNP